MHAHKLLASLFCASTVTTCLEVVHTARIRALDPRLLQRGLVSLFFGWHKTCFIRCSICKQVL